MSAARLHDALMNEADRLDKLDASAYHHAAHELRSMASEVRDSLDFSTPNQPLRSEVESVESALVRAAEFARILVELAPWLYEDDDDDSEDDPDPSPEGEPSATEARP